MREETGKRNQMTALRFQTGGWDIRHPWLPFGKQKQNKNMHLNNNSAFLSPKVTLDHLINYKSGDVYILLRALLWKWLEEEGQKLTQNEEFLAVGRACHTTFWPCPDLEQRTLDSSGFIPMMKMNMLLSLSLESASRSTGTNSSPESTMFSSEPLFEKLQDLSPHSVLIPQLPSLSNAYSLCTLPFWNVHLLSVWHRCYKGTLDWTKGDYWKCLKLMKLV